MKPLFWILFLAGTLAACNESGTGITIKTDSTTEQVKDKLDNIGEKIEEKAEQVWDSTKKKAKDLKNVEIQIKTRKDSVAADRRDTSRKK